MYLGVAVLLAGIAAQAAKTAGEVKRATGIPPRTVGRWRLWWRTRFADSRVLAAERGRFLPPLVIADLPSSLVERFAAPGQDATAAVVRTLCFLSPLGTASVADGLRFVRAR